MNITALKRGSKVRIINHPDMVMPKKYTIPGQGHITPGIIGVVSKVNRVSCRVNVGGKNLFFFPNELEVV